MPTKYDTEETDYTSFLTKPIGDVRYVNQTGDKMEGILDMGIHKITNLADPVGPTDAVNLKTIEPIKNSLVELTTTSASLSAATTQHSNHFIYGAVALEMNKNIDMNNYKLTELGNPTSDKQAATKKYVDDKVAGVKQTNFSNHLRVENKSLKLLKLLDADGLLIINVALPIAGEDVANKDYVDYQVITKGVAEHILKIIPIFVNKPINKRDAVVHINNINLGLRLQNEAQVSLLFNYHPYVIQISKVITGSSGAGSSANKLNISITLNHSTIINTFAISGFVVVTRFWEPRHMDYQITII